MANKSKKQNKGRAIRVSSMDRVNGIYHDELRRKGPRASVEQDQTKVIPRRQKYKEKYD